MYARVLLEIVLIAFVVAEVLIPMLYGTPLFPLFRRRRQGRLIGELEQARQDLTEDDIEDQVKTLREEHTKRHTETKEETNAEKHTS